MSDGTRIILGLLLLLVIGWLMVMDLGEGAPPKDQPAWSPHGDPLAQMDHHNVLICSKRLTGVAPPDTPPELLVSFLGGKGGGQQLKLFPTQGGWCAVLDLTKFGTVPVQVMVSPVGNQHTGFTATYWEPTGKPEPSPPYAWATAALTEREELWWIQFTFRSSNEPVTSVTVGVE